MTLVTAVSAAPGVVYECRACKRVVRMTSFEIARASVEFNDFFSPLWAVFPVDRRPFGDHGYVLCGDCHLRELRTLPRRNQ